MAANTMGTIDSSKATLIAASAGPSVIPKDVRASVIECTRNAVWACLLALSIAGSPTEANAAPSQQASPDYVIDGTKSTPDLMADLIMRFSLDEETAKLICEISADNFRRIKNGEVGKDDFVIHVRAIDRSNLIRVFGNDLSLAPLSNFSEVTGGEAEINMGNYEKVISALYDSSDVHLWLRKYNKDEYTASELVRYKNLKRIHLKEALNNMKELIALKDGRAEKLFQTFNTDIKTLTVMPSREAFRILFTTEVSKDFGEKVFAGTDEAKKSEIAAVLTTQLTTRALLTKKDLSDGGLNILFGKDSQHAVTQMIPTPRQLTEMQENTGGISTNIAQARKLAVNSMTKSYDSVISPLASKVKIEQFNKQIAAGEVTIAEGKATIDEGKATIARGKELDENIAKIDKNIANINKDRENIAKDRENIAKIGTIRKDINKTLRDIMNTSSKTEQDRLIATFNNEMTQFVTLRSEIQRTDSNKSTIEMLAAIDADIAIIRSHPGLKAFDKNLKPFTLAAK